MSRAGVEPRPPASIPIPPPSSGCDAIRFRTSRRSAADCQRSSGSLARHFMTMRSTPGGMEDWTARRLCGSRIRIDAIVLALLLPEKAGLAVRGFVEHGAKRENVDAMIGRLAFELLGRHVRAVPAMMPSAVSVSVLRCPDPGSAWRSRSRGASRRLGQHDVLGLQVAMHDSLAVRLVEGVGDVGRVRSASQRHGPASRRARASRRRGLHHQVVDFRCGADVVERADVRVIERGYGASLASNRARRSGSSRQWRQDFDGDVAVRDGYRGLCTLRPYRRRRSRR